MPRGKTKTTETEAEMQTFKVEKGKLVVAVMGTSPLIMNRMPAKARQQLLMPRKKTAADKAANLKHVPLAEFRDSMHRMPAGAPTAVYLPSVSFKKCLSSVATDIPGATKAGIGRLTHVTGQYVPVYGIPRLYMSIVRSADMNRTPDVRTRAIFPEWCAVLEITFIKPLLREQQIGDLLAAAGIMRGVGDYRVEKGAGDFGSFQIVAANDPQFKKLVKEGGINAQLAAIENPETYDDESAELLTWFETESAKRGFNLSNGTGTPADEDDDGEEAQAE